MRSPTDPLTDPRPGDVVRHISRVIPVPGPHLTVQAVVGNLVAFTSPLSRGINWWTREEWCAESAVTERWEVINVAPE
jgi:hypothetical protein